MIDRDDFDPMGKQWDPAHQDFLGEASSEKIADEALRVATAMLRACGGCPILPQLHEILWIYYHSITSHTLWSPTLKEADTLLYEKLDALSREETVCDRRIEAVAIRATKRLALQLRENYTSSRRHAQMQTDLAAATIKDLIGHSFLDISRAHSVGQRFETNEQALQFYEEVMQYIEPGAINIGRQLAKRPGAKRIRDFHIVQNTYTTSSILYNDDFSFD